VGVAECIVEFDYRVNDGRDWIGELNGSTLLIDNFDADQVDGATVDFHDGNSG